MFLKYVIHPLTVSISLLSWKLPTSGDYLFSAKGSVILERTAVLVDGAFFIKRALRIFGAHTPTELANRLFFYSCKHLRQKRYAVSIPSKPVIREMDYLYRIFFYDCPPLSKKIHHPLTNQLIDFEKSEQSKWRLEFHNEMKKRRKVALRLGTLDENELSWNITYDKIKKLCRKEIQLNDLTDKDFKINLKQKGVDMRIGLDISSLAFKKQVSKIILISGDSDFVPAAKQARREGIDFVLDPMWAKIKPDLHEHIDGLHSTFPKPTKPLSTSKITLIKSEK